MHSRNNKNKQQSREVCLHRRGACTVNHILVEESRLLCGSIKVNADVSVLENTTEFTDVAA